MFILLPVGGLGSWIDIGRRFIFGDEDDKKPTAIPDRGIDTDGDGIPDTFVTAGPDGKEKEVDLSAAGQAMSLIKSVMQNASRILMVSLFITSSAIFNMGLKSSMLGMAQRMKADTQRAVEYAVDSRVKAVEVLAMAIDAAIGTLFGSLGQMFEFWQGVFKAEQKQREETTHLAMRD